MRGRSVHVGDGAELDHTIAGLIGRGYVLVHRTERTATLVRQRQARFLSVLAVSWGLLAMVLFVDSANSGGDTAAGAYTCLVIGGVVVISRNWYLAVRRDQVTHVSIRQE